MVLSRKSSRSSEDRHESRREGYAGNSTKGELQETSTARAIRCGYSTMVSQYDIARRAIDTDDLVGNMVSARLLNLVGKDRVGVVHLSSDLIDTGPTTEALRRERMVAIALRRAPFRLAESR